MDAARTDGRAALQVIWICKRNDMCTGNCTAAALRFLAAPDAFPGTRLVRDLRARARTSIIGP